MPDKKYNRLTFEERVKIETYLTEKRSINSKIDTTNFNEFGKKTGAVINIILQLRRAGVYSNSSGLRFFLIAQKS